MRLRLGVGVLVCSVCLVLWSATALAAVGGDYLDYYEESVADTVIGRLHVCNGVSSTYRYISDKGVDLEIKRQDTYPTVGAKLTIGWQRMVGVSTSAYLTNNGTTGSTTVKTGLRYRLEHWAHVDPYPSPPRAVDSTGPSVTSLPPGQVTKRWDICKVYSNPGYPLTRGSAITGDNAPAAELQAYEYMTHPTYGFVVPASPGGGWTRSYYSGWSLGVSATAWGFSVGGKTYFGSGVSQEHTFSWTYSRYWGYDRKSGEKEWYFSHN